MGQDQGLKITEILAIYGAILSTVVFLWNANRVREKVAVKIVFGLDGKDDDIQSGVYVFVQNSSPSTVHISGLSILYPSKKTNIFDILIKSIKYRRFFRTYGWVHTSLSLYDLDDGCPTSIEPGQAHKVFIPDKVVNKILEDAVCREIMASAQDQLWNDSCSKIFDMPNNGS